MKIGFDFDKVFVNFPPFIPTSLVHFLYKKRTRRLSYRIPGKIEQKVRILSHHPVLRKPITKNVQILQKIAKQNNHDLYLISGRFGFLKQKTEEWIIRHNMQPLFKEIHFNFKNKQPHLEKNRVIQKTKIDTFIDDDLDLLLYLAKQNPKIQFYWVKNGERLPQKRLPKNITPIHDLLEFYNLYFEKKKK